MIPRRLRRRQPKPRTRYLLQATRPLTVEQAREIERRWVEFRRSGRQEVVIEGIEVKEIRL